MNNKARLVYLASLPIDPSYREGYRCDYCFKYFEEGPLYHCVTTGTDACLPCARKGGGEEKISGGRFLAKVGFPEKVLYDEVNSCLQRVASEEESLHGLRGSLNSSVVLGYQCEQNVIGVLLANGTNILGLLEGKSVAAGWVVQPGSAPLHDMLKSVFHERPSQSPSKVSATPIYPAHFASLFPWFMSMAALVISSRFESDVTKQVTYPVFDKVASQLPTFIACTSIPSESQTSGDRVLFLLSSDVLQIFSFKEGLEIAVDSDTFSAWEAGTRMSASQQSTKAKGVLDWARAVLIHMCGI